MISCLCHHLAFVLPHFQKPQLGSRELFSPSCYCMRAIASWSLLWTSGHSLPHNINGISPFLCFPFQVLSDALMYCKSEVNLLHRWIWTELSHQCWSWTYRPWTGQLWSVTFCHLLKNLITVLSRYVPVSLCNTRCFSCHAAKSFF